MPPSPPPSLSSLPLSPSIHHALSSAGITTPSQLLSLSPRALTRLTSLAPTSQTLLLSHLHSVLSPPLLPPPSVLPPISLPSPLNKILGTPLPSHCVAQIAGAPSTAKTQTAFSLAAHLLQHNHPVVWLDATNLSAIHLKMEQLLLKRGISISRQSTMLQNLVVLPACTYPKTIQVLTSLRDDCKLLDTLSFTHTPVTNAIANMRLLVFDSVANVISPLLGLKLEDGWSGHVGMTEIASSLRWFANKGVCVLVTNRVVKTDTVTHAALGRLWDTLVDVNVLVQNAGDSVHARVESKIGRGGECHVKVGDRGIVDV